MKMKEGLAYANSYLKDNMLAYANCLEAILMALENMAALKGANPGICDPRITVSQQAVPLSMVGVGEKVHVKFINGKDDTRRFLCNLGFIEGAEVSVVSELSGNVIVNVKGTRLAISKAMANRVLTFQSN